MAIDTECPHCRKAYRLKDDFAGKRVTCANPDCRKVFTAERPAAPTGPASPAAGLAPAKAPPPTATATAPLPGGTPPPMQKLPGPPSVADPTPLPPGKTSPKPPAPPVPKKVPTAQKAPPRPPVDAEALASKVLADGTAAEAPKTIAMTCYLCEHKWEEDWDKQGKNVLCPQPDCRHRQKVPIVKQEDWRTQNKPAGAKIDNALTDVMGDKTTYVSGQAMREAGAIVEDVEERPRWHYAAAVTVAVALFAGVWLGVASVRQTKIEVKEDRFMEDAIANLTKAPPDTLPKAEAPLYQAALFMAAGEHSIRRNDPKHARNATAEFAQARAALADAPPSGDRDALLVELAAAQVMLGGDEAQVRDQTRLAWQPQPAPPGRARIKAEMSDVQTELQRTLGAMLKAGADKTADARFAAARRVTRELCRRGQPRVLAPVLSAGFEARELPEAAAQVAMEVFRETKDADLACQVAERFSLPKTWPPPPTAQPLSRALNLPDRFKPLNFISEPKNPAVGASETTRKAYVAEYMTQNDVAKSVELAAGPGSAKLRLDALALVAEWAAEPAPAVEAAAKVAAEPRKQNEPPVPGLAVTRIIQAAARCGQHDKVETLAAAIPDLGLKEWAKADAFRIRLRSTPGGKSEDEAAAPLPPHPKDYKVGHAWARLALARHNTAVTNDARADTYDRWGDGTFKPFGLAGLALGLQDRNSSR